MTSLSFCLSLVLVLYKTYKNGGSPNELMRQTISITVTNMAVILILVNLFGEVVLKYTPFIMPLLVHIASLY